MDKDRSPAFVLAPCRLGKGVGFIFPDLDTYEGEVVVCDPQGKSFTIPARWKEGPSHG